MILRAVSDGEFFSLSPDSFYFLVLSKNLKFGVTF